MLVRHSFDSGIHYDYILHFQTCQQLRILRMSCVIYLYASMRYHSNKCQKRSIHLHNKNRWATYESETMFADVLNTRILIDTSYKPRPLSPISRALECLPQRPLFLSKSTENIWSSFTWTTIYSCMFDSSLTSCFRRKSSRYVLNGDRIRIISSLVTRFSSFPRTTLRLTFPR